MNKVWAQIKNGIVQNTIVLDDESLIPVFTQGFDHLIRIDDLVVQPTIDWLYDGISFREQPRD